MNVHPTSDGGDIESAVEAPPRPRARGWIHRVSFLAAGPAGLVLLAVAPTWQARVAVGVYALTLAAMFWVSSTYHRGSWSGKAWARWQRRDHAAIFLLIAGSYTPYCVLVLEGAWGPSMLAVTWIGAAVGILVKLYRVDLHVLSGVMYLGLGWVGVVVFPQFVPLWAPSVPMVRGRTPRSLPDATPEPLDA